MAHDAAFDSTGYEAGHVSRYFAKRSGQELKRYGKLGTVIDTRSYLILAMLTAMGPAPDDPLFQPLVKDAYLNLPFYWMLADAGADGENHHAFVREKLGAKTLIPPLRGRPTSKPPRGKYRREMAIVFGTKKHRKHYGQRWHVEGSYSQDKRRFGSWLGSKNHNTQSREMRLRALLHNIAIILRETLQCFQQSKPDPFCSAPDPFCSAPRPLVQCPVTHNTCCLDQRTRRALKTTMGRKQCPRST